MSTIALSRWQFFTALAVLAVSGLLGGTLATWLLPGRAAWAQDTEERIPDDGNPGLWVYDVTGEQRVRISMLADGTPGVALYDTAGEPRAVLNVAAEGPRLWLNDGARKVRALLSLWEGRPSLTLLDDTGKVLWQAP